ncbi:iron complex outermembrane recepter protein [Sinomicrobium oceani]|uniref:Iron complex outermembrane recepter protein n=1 Tax=Sinomicrobium oceani TaxID=1150368 RepID=A0A1K1M561_9FLAO|nr:TonB-dependent receptor [Sinomicrobium oceani]SFW18264.1 iron complex outermembrane recepter protein [Sinomicrobium oceani]
MKKIYCSLVLFLFLLPRMAVAQEETGRRVTDTTQTEINYLDEVDVVGTKILRTKRDSVSPGLKLRQPLILIPQNIVRISSELLQQQGALELKDAARNSSGVYFSYNSTPFDQSSALQIRGFTGYTTLNGMSRRFSYGASIDDEAVMESVEIVKGPAGFLNATGEPGGSVNIVTKTPDKKIRSATVMGGSFNFYRAAIDIGSAVKDTGFSYRFNAAYQHKDSYLDFMRTDKVIIAPVLQYNFSPRTFVLAEYNFIRGNIKNGAYLAKVRSESEKLKGPVSRNYSAAPGLPDSYAKNETVRLVFHHKFDDHWDITSQSSYLAAPYETWYMTTNGSIVSFDEAGNTERKSSLTMGSGTTWNSQLFANGSFRTGHVAHEIVLGTDFTNSKDSLALHRGVYDFPYSKYTYRNRVNKDSVRETSRLIRIENNTYLRSVYAYDNIRLHKRWLLSLGARYTWYTNKRRNVTAAGPGEWTEFDQKALTPRAGLTFSADPSTSVFFLYDQSFVPQSGMVAIQTNPETNEVTASRAVDPQKGNDLELGIKKNWFGSRLSTSLNGFYTVKTNVLVSNLELPGFVKEIGEVTSSGVEVDVLGSITDRLSVSANYTYVHARITEDQDPEQIGKELPQAPQQIFNTWLQYTIPLKHKARIGFSLGQVTQVKRSTSTTHRYIPDFTKVDAGINYATGRYFVRLLADNITGKRYMASGDIFNNYMTGNPEYFYIDGEPFNLQLAAGIRF